MVEAVKNGKTAFEIAQEEIEHEERKEAVSAFKNKLAEKRRMEKALENVEREIEDLKDKYGLIEK